MPFGGSGRPHAVGGLHCCNSGCVHNWQLIRLEVVVAPGIWPAPKLFLLGFPMCTSAAFLSRRKPAYHKRLILLATIGLIGAAAGRMQFLPFWRFHGIAAIRLVWAYTYVFLLPLAAYDLWSTRKLNRATAWGSLFMISAQQAILLVSTTAPWYLFVRWMQSWGI